MSTGSPDPDGLRYLEHWEPVLAGAALRLLERVAALASESSLTSGRPTPGATEPLALLDVGAGTGSLVLAAAERWPGARIMGLDASTAMLSVARQRVSQRWPDGGAGRFEWFVADAAAMPLEDASVDVVVSSFALQLLPDRRAALGEVRRVLRPGGLFGVVTWLADDQMLLPDVEFDEAVHDLALEDPEVARRQPDVAEYESLAQVRADLDRAGLGEIDVRPDHLAYDWSRGAYRRFKMQYDERDLVLSLSAADRARLLGRVDERWAGLPDDAFALHAPLASATARRPVLPQSGH